MFATTIEEGEITPYVQRRGSAWIVRLNLFGDVFSVARYRVLRNATGYCVDRILSS